MPTREEIRRGIAHRIEDEADNGYLKHWEETTELLTLDQRWDYLLKVADLIMGDESKQGVVIKVDRELPLCPNQSADDGRIEHNFIEREAWIGCRDQILKAGYGAFEPLIKEE